MLRSALLGSCRELAFGSARTSAKRPQCRAGGPGVRARAPPNVRQSGEAASFEDNLVWGETLVVQAPDCPMSASLVTERLPVNLRHCCRLGRQTRAPLCSPAPDLEVSLAPAPHATGTSGPRFSRTCSLLETRTRRLPRSTVPAPAPLLRAAGSGEHTPPLWGQVRGSGILGRGLVPSTRHTTPTHSLCPGNLGTKSAAPRLRPSPPPRETAHRASFSEDRSGWPRSAPRRHSPAWLLTRPRPFCSLQPPNTNSFIYVF